MTAKHPSRTYERHIMTYGVYVHVPFCLRRCGYCDFNTYTAFDLGGGASRGNYATMVVREMRLVRDWQLAHGIEEPEASTVFFGGGTPTILPASDLIAMLDAVRDVWGLEPDAEITTEANPDTVDADYIRELADGGFTRISFGMQSAVPHVLKTLDRTHTPANVEAGVRAAERAGLRSSVDLIYGAPGESLDDWRESVRTAIDLGVDHISAYALTVEPTTRMGRQIAAGILPKPDDDDEAAKYEIADELFTAAGLRWYEVSNWARPGFESRHNLGYWRNVDWAGLGPGAHSHYSLDGNDMRAWDITHPKLWGQSIADGTVPWAGSETISAQEHLEEVIMLGVRLREGLAIADVERAAGHAIPRERFDGLRQAGLIDVADDSIVPTLRGRLLNDTIIEQLFDLLG
ncbi:coproporphyrinogen III oxidase [Bifidobacterium eulemuris]|uniref:Heme chaperone HemW n=2 Tax=Bifidobacterium eulemuris TaxID=1765219 RepID=A0A7L9SMS0_9BIFI|nr:coproporphyrinogen III oxidase [Bifidobacterium eulemuris]